jgi:hypothetical protein
MIRRMANLYFRANTCANVLFGICFHNHNVNVFVQFEPQQSVGFQKHRLFHPLKAPRALDRNFLDREAPVVRSAQRRMHKSYMENLCSDSESMACRIEFLPDRDRAVQKPCSLWPIALAPYTLDPLRRCRPSHRTLSAHPPSLLQASQSPP